ncbi:MAG: ATP-binding protein, partial [Alphaproteobacteria bacterium]
MTRIDKVLIANRGEIASRIVHTLRELGIASVAVYHRVDATGPAVRAADEAVEIFGETPVAAYLDADGIIAACRASGADAVHPGYGFLAENAGFARALAEAGIAFIGPTPKIIDLMGDKMKARAMVADHGFPVAPSAEEVTVTPSAKEETGGDADFAARARAIGFPLLIKAAAGGGGKGMRIVTDEAALADELDRARGEATRYFGDGRVYCERYIEKPRHIEVQILADHHGNCIHLWERECSIQRRFQKIVEESPSPALNPEKRAEICAAAVGIAKAAGYRNAGTVEFIQAPDGSFYFLEMNTRLQVEHPVTEMITGLDLVAEQVRVARGEKLSLAQADVASTGHAIECRIY